MNGGRVVSLQVALSLRKSMLIGMHPANRMVASYQIESYTCQPTISRDLWQNCICLEHVTISNVPKVMLIDTEALRTDEKMPLLSLSFERGTEYLSRFAGSHTRTSVMIKGIPVNDISTTIGRGCPPTLHSLDTIHPGAACRNHPKCMILISKGWPTY
jgi:hypothetical protein